MACQKRVEKYTNVGVHCPVGCIWGWVPIVTKKVIDQWVVGEGDVGLCYLWKLG